MSLRSTWLSAVADLLIAGCAVGPNYHRPDTPMPAAFKEAWQPAIPADEVPRGPWWKSYADPTLTGLEGEALHSNQTIRAAAAQYRAAAAAVGGTRAALFPTVSAGASSTRSSGFSGNNGSAAASGTGGATTVDRLTASVDWELDLWGRLRRGLEQSRNAAEASAGDLAAVQLSVTATLAQDYVQLRALDLQRELLARTVTAYQRSLQITQNRYNAGVAQSTDLTQAQSQLANAEAQAADLRVQRAPLEHAIATLAGKTPEEFALDPLAQLPTLPGVPSAVPAMLLERRPDVAAAERRVASANAAIGVARGAWFPTLSLSGTGGYQGSAWQHLITVPARYWSVGPALAETLFDAGARHAQSAAARANYDAAVANYREAVLTALKDAEDSLATLRGLADQEKATSRAALAASETLRVTENQYRAGTVSYLNVVIAQSSSLSADNALINVQSRRLLAHISLLKALGGMPETYPAAP